jgi:hypothetical protein
MDAEFSIIIHMFFGLFGIAFLTYGRKQRALIPLIVGLLLLSMPYFISDFTILITAGILITILPYFISSPEL